MFFMLVLPGNFIGTFDMVGSTQSFRLRFGELGVATDKEPAVEGDSVTLGVAVGELEAADRPGSQAVL